MLVSVLRVIGGGFTPKMVMGADNSIVLEDSDSLSKFLSVRGKILEATVLSSLVRRIPYFVITAILFPFSSL